MDHQRHTHDAGFLRLCAALAILGFALMIVSNIVGSVIVPGHDVLADTISDLGAGRYEYIQDIGFYTYAGGLAALALGLSHLHSGQNRWSYGVFGLTAIALLTVVIGARNEYGDADHDGWVIHIYLVYALAFFIATVPFALRDGLRRWGRTYQRWAGLFGGAWWLAAPIFFFLPTQWDGAWERGLGLAATAWFSMLAVGLWRQAGR